MSRSVILVVEDEALLRMVVVLGAEEAGFEVIEASNADQAIKILEARNDIRLVFTDIDMPGSMDGLKLAHAVRDRWPPVELIVTSGHYSVAPGPLPARGRYIGKPYDATRLPEMFKEMIAGS
jgi:CheY-like chemotaxis protein